MGKVDLSSALSEGFLIAAIKAVVFVGLALIVIRLVSWALRSSKRAIQRVDPQELARKAGSLTGKATEATKSARDAFMDGYKNKR